MSANKYFFDGLDMYNANFSLGKLIKRDKLIYIRNEAF